MEISVVLVLVKLVTVVLHLIVRMEEYAHQRAALIVQVIHNVLLVKNAVQEDVVLDHAVQFLTVQVD